jgi:hypothetical protein
MGPTGFSCATRAIAHRETLQRVAGRTWNMSGVQKLKFSRLLDAGTMTPGAPAGFSASWRKHRGEGERGKGEMGSVIRFEEIDSWGSEGWTSFRFHSWSTVE